MPVGAIVGLSVAVVALLLIVLLLCSYVKSEPDEAIMISGLHGMRIICGKSGWRLPFLQRKDRLSLRVFLVDVAIREPISANGLVDVDVRCVADLKVASDAESLERAFSAMSGMSYAELAECVKPIIAASLRDAVAAIGHKQLVQDRKCVVEAVKENTLPALGKLGLELVDLDIDDVYYSCRVVDGLAVVVTAAPPAPSKKTKGKTDLTE